MKARWFAGGAVIGAAVVLTLGFGWAGARPSMFGTSPSSGGWSWEDMEAMHDSPWMQRIHAQMPDDLQEQCDAMHEQMGASMGGGHMQGNPGGMMTGSGGSGMMGGSGGSGMMGESGMMGG